MLVAAMAFAAPIDGKWVGEIPGMDGAPMKVSYTFKADGATLTGTTSSPGPDAKETAIKDGKIHGNNLSFSIAFDMGGQEMKMEIKGVLSGDNLKLSMDMMGQPMEIQPQESQITQEHVSATQHESCVADLSRLHQPNSPQPYPSNRYRYRISLSQSDTPDIQKAA